LELAPTNAITVEMVIMHSVGQRSKAMQYQIYADQIKACISRKDGPKSTSN